MNPPSNTNYVTLAVLAAVMFATHQSSAAPQLFGSNSGSSNGVNNGGGFGGTGGGAQFGSPVQQQPLGQNQMQTMGGSAGNPGFSVGLFTGGTTGTQQQQQGFPASSAFDQGSQQRQNNGGFGGAQQQFSSNMGGGGGVSMSGSTPNFSPQPTTGNSQFGSQQQQQPTGINSFGFSQPPQQFGQQPSMQNNGQAGGFGSISNVPAGNFQQPQFSQSTQQQPPVSSGNGFMGGNTGNNNFQPQFGQPTQPSSNSGQMNAGGSFGGSRPAGNVDLQNL